MKRLAHLSVIENELISLPPEIGQLKELTYLNCSHNRIIDIPKEIGLLTKLEEIDLSVNRISELPKEIENLKLLNSLDVSSNNFYSIDFDVFKLDSLINFNIKGNFLSEEKKQIYFDFLYKLSKKGFQYSKIIVPGSIKIALKQYLLFFKEYVRIAKKQEVYFEVRDTLDGLEIETITNESNESRPEVLEVYFKEYLKFIEKDFEIINIEGEVEPIKIDLLRLRLEQQVNNLEQQLNLIKFENKYFKSVIDRFMEIQLSQTKVRQLNSSKLNFYDTKDELKLRLAKNYQTNEVIEEILVFAKKNSDKIYNEIVLLYLRYNRLELEARIGVLSEEQKELERRKIIKSILDSIDLIREM